MFRFYDRPKFCRAGLLTVAEMGDSERIASRRELARPRNRMAIDKLVVFTILTKTYRWGKKLQRFTGVSRSFRHDGMERIKCKKAKIEF